MKSLLLICACVLGACFLQAQQSRNGIPAALEPQLKQFFADKQAQSRALAKEEQKEQLPEVWEFFDAGVNGDWMDVARIYRNLRRGAYQYEGTKSDARLVTMVWQPVNEGYGAYEQCGRMDEKYITMYAREILDSMPRGSIYFGGTDSGRWVPTAFSKSHVRADPIFIITQNALADGLYLKYVRAMYGDRINVPTEADSKKAFAEYTEDAGKRLAEGRLKPGENVKDVDGKVQVSGQVAVMAINALIAKTIFDTNSRKEFFIEESFPLDWMYPHLSPHGLIMKLNRQPLAEMSKETVQKNQDYWMRFTDQALGKWLRSTTSVEVVCDFADRVFQQMQSEPFQPDERFVRNDYACKAFSKLRSAQAGVYAWRAKNGSSADEKRRMTEAADFAFRQAFALCPSSPEAVFRYVNVLVDQKRFADAIRIAQTADAINPGGGNYSDLMRELERLKDAAK